MKTQMKFQKWLCFVLLILGALSIVYALGYCTGVLAGLSTCIIQNVLYLEDAQIYLDVQSFNNALLYLGIVILLAVVVLYITATNKRRNYYITNYIASIAVAVLLIALSIYIIAENGYWLSQVSDFLNDSTAMANYEDLYENYSSVIYYSTSTLMFWVGFILYALIIVGALLLVGNLIWKIKLMKGEKALLENGFAKEVA